MNPLARATPFRDRRPDEFLDAIAATCERAAAGDFEARIERSSGDARLDRLARAINRVLDVSDAYVRESAAATENASQGRFHRPILERGLTGAYADAARTVNEALLRMKEDDEALRALEAGRERTTRDVTEATAAVAAACEQLNGATGEIRAQVGHSADLTGEAVRVSEQSAEAIESLGGAARRIEAAAGLIAHIARHTNLLALNAMIEAARAGVHGAGFAVVAGEVKVLSQDTARATEEITAIVAEMVAATGRVTAAIGAVGGSIRDVDANTAAVLASLEKQVRATGEISARVSAVAERTREMSRGGRG